MRSISDIFITLKTDMTGETVCIDNILEALHERGFGFLILILAVPMALPIPVPPGINVALALPLILLTAQQAIGRHTIWLPEWMRTKTIKAETMRSMIDGLLPWCKRLEIIVKPRLEFITFGIFSRLIGVSGLIMALAVCVPLPMTNTVPSLGIALMAVGVIMRDGYAVIAGAVIGLVWVCLLIFLGVEAMELAKEFIKTYF
ncbi:MAG: hypothetical protein GC137_00295 [Alphaproteobacteria bacterium]|nr:hypothetical protein [Alphaproteobacteria bacterium]